MKSATEIRLNFQQALSRAGELEEVASELRQLANRELENALQDLSSAWKGDSAEAYIKKGFLLGEKMEKSAKDLEKTAATIRSVAKRIYDAEMRAYRLALARTYKT